MALGVRGGGVASTLSSGNDPLLLLFCRLLLALSLAPVAMSVLQLPLFQRYFSPEVVASLPEFLPVQGPATGQRGEQQTEPPTGIRP